MAEILLTSTAPPDDPARPYPYDELHRMERSAENDAFGEHRVTGDPAQADIILYVENCDPIQHYLEVRDDAYYEAFPEKCFLFSRYDHPLPILPGVYTSIPKRWHRTQRTRSGPYLNAFDHDFIAPAPRTQDRDLLYSFVGKKSTHPVRSHLFALEHPHQFLFDTDPYWPYGELPDDQQAKLQHQYVDVAHRSQFILCPRGRGASSIRLFESLRMGRAPVIISDQWVPPNGPDWYAFSVRVAEKHVHRLPDLLAARAHESETMGLRAREAWENWFAERAVFHRVVNWCLEIKDERELPERILRFSVLPQLFHPLYMKAVVRTLLPEKLKSSYLKAVFS